MVPTMQNNLWEFERWRNKIKEHWPIEQMWSKIAVGMMGCIAYVSSGYEIVHAKGDHVIRVQKPEFSLEHRKEIFDHNDFVKEEHKRLERERKRIDSEIRNIDRGTYSIPKISIRKFNDI